MKRGSRRWGALLAGAVIAGCLAAGAIPAAPAAAAAPPTFTDMAGDEWFAEAVGALAAEGIIKGRDDGSFSPNDPITRAQMAAFLARTLGLQRGPASIPFEDVGLDSWYYEPVAALYGAGLVSGTTPTEFSPEVPVTRQQAASLIVRALESSPAEEPRPDVDLQLAEDQASAWLVGFRDRLLIAPAHAVSVANAYRLGVIEGAEDGWLYPGLNLTRAQMAAMLYRAFLQPITPSHDYPAALPAEPAYPTQSKGCRGMLVAFLESRLTALRYPCGDVDGVYDDRTRDAVMAFEKVERLQRDGVADAQVWQHLFMAQTPVPRLSAAGTRLEVDLTRQVVFVVRENAVTEVIHCSTGKAGTPPGHGKMWLMQTGWQECSVGWMFYPCYFYPHIAIHGSSSVPPWPASHGCVRTPNWIAPWVYSQAFIGMSVDVYY
ncbi:MAG: S-layer homology domain-containing protein [Thermoleophilia bacterium]|nr:S-layer homology domain-containing protein [Thermoleophilia bacterium]